ncbi:dynamin family protein [uncultured Roseobacter sp.]|uniref:dynamin family protein n=1 Tax=uncultured Roseobacter sp. TaxID=114847 RepID=UPI00262A8844|nr:dynamin family protein [uncultured Roseobacter sp.]
MNVMNITDRTDFAVARLLSAGLSDLHLLAEDTERLRDALKVIETCADENAARRAARVVRQIDAFEPSVTMIGQIKSGKTTLVNAFAGHNDLLPADVNPWTSVVTSLHMHPEKPDFKNTAIFRFFDEDEWEKLVCGGGRIGELASRAGADEELEQIKEQVSRMREKSKARLGRKFEMLLGQEHDYGYFDKELVERYVCLGDDYEDPDGPGGDEQGRFADITKSADISLQRGALPMPICIRDTPGVNDTFLMREQITIRAIRDSRLCVVVLSAHQALSSTDLALIRLIAHVKSRDVLIFVNRTDELADPPAQINQISKSIADTLEAHNGPTDAQVIFGSALWACAALDGDLGSLPPASKRALDTRISHENPPAGAEDLSMDDPLEAAWAFSGLPELQKAVAERIQQGVGAAMLHRAATSGLNLANGLTAANSLLDADPAKRNKGSLSVDDARVKMHKIAESAARDLDKAFDEIIESFSERMNRVQESFLERATASLTVHLEKFGEQSPWTYDPAGLRVLLSASHKVLARKSTAAFDKAAGKAAEEIAGVYHQAFGLGSEDIPITLPAAPQVPPPVSLGRTIALDLQGSWWKRWWVQRKGYKAYASGFVELIRAETDPFVEELRDDLAESVRQTACAEFETFVNEQLSVFETMEKMYQKGAGKLAEFVENSAPRERQLQMKTAIETLRGLVAE